LSDKVPPLAPGDFSDLAKQYSENRPDYSLQVLHAITGLLPKPLKQVDFVDVGAGTGIWTRMVSNLAPKTVTAVEPNEAMRELGKSYPSIYPINWLQGTAESTKLNDRSCDWVSMASSLHWADMSRAIQEFSRILRPGGVFTALWNPRLIEKNPLLLEIEEYISARIPKSKRISSGMSGVTENLTEYLESSGFFEDIVYIESQHTLNLSRGRYLGIWKSVNDIRVQLGENEFNSFLNFVEFKIQNLNEINATYLTRSWTARKKNIIK
jgi:ubiquinone/menaquinone biosynthesis C-methylase UbiE